MIACLAVLLAGTVPWSLLLGLNLKVWPGVPWAVPAEAIWLWGLWRYLRGWGWPRSAAAARRRDLRAEPLRGGVWAWSLAAGVLASAGLIAAYLVVESLVRVPQQQFPDVSKIPAVTVVCSLLMAAVVAGLVEEAAFRGYLQAPLERRYGPVTAILVTGALFGLAHALHAEWTPWLILLYMASSAIFGTLAFLTGSILPAAVLHGAADAIAYMFFWTRGGVPPPPRLVWEAGAGSSFWIALVATVLLGGAGLWAFRRLRAECAARDAG
ncbi:MAG: CPBP family intramembrane metalloprotease [Acidobacteria bacterium]|nr:CPBP family intramembrane metalloprotease [Acidobacteriota bacterium]